MVICWALIDMKHLLNADLEELGHGQGERQGRCVPLGLDGIDRLP
ncbi:hypothetical protein T261_1521 [Streptomyces lydicus]|nr:hypothetical protein T261_1521 [Streptomyces lydicus]